MEISMFRFLGMVVLVFLSCADAITKENKQESRKTYIIHVDKCTKPASFIDHFQWYENSLKSVSDSAEMLYTYSSVVHGFSTRLTVEEANLHKKQPRVLSVLSEVRYELHTTRTPEFLGLGRSNVLFPASSSAGEVIVGVLDTGVWPELPSFDDAGLDRCQPPRKACVR